MTSVTKSMTLEDLDAIAPGAVKIRGAVDSGTGEIRLTVDSTAGWSTGDLKSISGVLGAVEANGKNWAITVIDDTHIDLQGSKYRRAYSGCGTVGGSIDALDSLITSLDDFN